VSDTPFWRRQLPAIVIGLGNVFAIGLGAGLPVFSVLLAAGGLAGASFIVLLIVWGPHLPQAFDPAVSAETLGVPLILFTSQASKIGWFALMMLGGPLLQFMAFVTAAAIGLTKRPKGTDASAA
jgi:hypothetical protein